MRLTLQALPCITGDSQPTPPLNGPLLSLCGSWDTTVCQSVPSCSLLHTCLLHVFSLEEHEVELLTTVQT